MSKTITIVDYGLGNLFSVSHAFEHIGADVKLVSTAAEIEKAEMLVLPGVGSFLHGMQRLNALGLSDSLKQFAKSQRPLLGICLGMQLLFDESHEFGIYKGLSILPGKVVPIPQKSPKGETHKIPHIGWNELQIPSHLKDWDGTYFHGLPQHSSVYFVHSFTAQPVDETHRLADADYNGCQISAAVQAGLILGCQFHPEKSGEVGLNILRHFVELDG